MHRLEETWLTVSAGILIIFMFIVGYQTFAMGMGPPSNKETIDPQKVEETAPFDHPGVFKVGENKYEVVMTMEAFSFNPDDITVPKGAEVEFVLTTKDVVHGFQVAGTNINAMVTPGHIQRISQTFDEPGEYLILCNEYCGVAHQLMSTTITVN
ncbi:cytochrome c oxidase subunit II [Bacillus piscicola]|uniref:cytochrome c oxidase subunit II n=1 Tax=Bacillus piscicola TaxID=1632684 RepID=UPI001F099955|nr:cytochrome c oxidase subunit II [Bacillus piscicola]